MMFRDPMRNLDISIVEGFPSLDRHDWSVMG